jgi:divalent metal cation (Fe/Co/Zn/Cd) transporter
MDTLQTPGADLFLRRALLNYITTSWHAIAAVTAIAAGFISHSIALAGFGLVSAMQAGSSLLLLRRFHVQVRRTMSKQEERVHDTLLFILGVLLFLIALFILNESGSAFFYKEHPDTSRAGLVLALLGFIVMSVLAFFKMQTARLLDSMALRSEAKENGVATYLSCVLFTCLLIHILHGWWWADPLGALFMLPYILREGWKALQESKGTSSLPGETTRLV